MISTGNNEGHKDTQPQEYRVRASIEITGEFVVTAMDKNQAERIVQEWFDEGQYDDTDEAYWTSQGAVIDAVEEVQ